MSERNDSLKSCPPCRSPERCLGLNGECGMVLDKLAQGPRTYKGHAHTCALTVIGGGLCCTCDKRHSEGTKP